MAAERRRQERIRIGRESFERKRRQGSRGASMEFDRSTTPLSVVEKEVLPRSTGRQFTKEAIRRENEEERERRRREKEKEDEDREEEEMRSRFIEGSMRDRASVPPPREIIGPVLPAKEEVAGGNGSASEEEGNVSSSSGLSLGSDREGKKKRFTFGLGSLFKFNPFSIVEEAKAAYARQKALHDERERKKEEMKKQKKEAEQLYFEMKARGEFKGTLVRHPDDVGGATSMDDDFAASFSDQGNMFGGSARKRKRAEIASIGSDMDEYFPPDEDEDDGDETEVDEPEEEPMSVKYEDTAIAPSHGQTETKPKNALDIVSRTSIKVFAGSISTTSIASTMTAGSNGGPVKPLTKRELKKAERLQKKVSNLEEQLEKVRRELEETARGAIPPMPELPSQMSPPAPPHPTPVSRASQDKNSNGMPPPPVPYTKKGARSQTMLSETPAQKIVTRHPNQMLPDSPEPSPADNRFAPGVMSPGTVDEDTEMDEGFSQIPLSPVLNSSVTEPPQEPTSLVVNRRRGTGRSKSPGVVGRSKSPGLTGLRKISGASVRKVSNAISNAVMGGGVTGAETNKPDRKKRRGLDNDDVVPPIPPVPQQ